MKVGLPLLVLLSIAACGRDPVSTATKSSGSPAAQAAAAGADTVAAVAQGGASRPVTLRFALEGKPRVGATSQLRLEFSAASPQAGVLFRVEGEELGLNDAATPQMIDLTEEGKSVTRTVTIAPRSPGLAVATVHVQPSGAESAEILYDIPVLADPAG